MRFKIDKKILQNNLNYVNKAVSSKTPIPALSGIKFDLSDAGLVLIGSSLETSIKAFIPVSVNDNNLIDIESVGSAIINNNFITEIVKKVEEDTIFFEMLDGNNIKISTTTATFNLNCISSEEYPKIDIEKSADVITISKQEMSDIINQTVFAVSRNESRPILTGVCFSCIGNTINISATDSYRLSNKVIKHNSDVNSVLIIPGKSLYDLNSICSGNGDIHIHVFGNKVMFEFDNVVFQTKLLEGTYPNTQKLIPTEFSTEVSIDSHALIGTIERASILSRDKTKNVIKLSLNNGSAMISANSPEVGKIKESIAVNSDNPMDIDISFSARFVKEAVNSLNCEKVTIKLLGDMKPIIIVNPEDDSITQLVLPVRTY